MAETVRILLRGGVWDGKEREITRELRLTTKQYFVEDEAYVPTGETEERDGVSLPVYRYDPDA